ncbi:hypothetical protein EV360DRAFT_75447 [Lentinula raphanica]|nr:hypothetical protein EV360DRAFT_75447 [Lentinula raphanica]
MVLFISRLLLCFLPYIPLGFVVTGYPLPSTSNVPLDITHWAEPSESDQAEDSSSLFPYTFGFRLPDHDRLSHLTKLQNGSFDWSPFNMRQEEIYLVFGGFGGRSRVLRCSKNDQSEPQQNPLWPYEVEIQPTRMQEGQTLSLEEIRAQLQLQGCVSNSRKALHYFKKKEYIEEIPHGFDSGTHDAWVEEKEGLQKEYVNRILAHYREAPEILANPRIRTRQVQLGWKLHRLFYNYCELYHLTYYNMRDAPPGLSIILIDGKRLRTSGRKSEDSSGSGLEIRSRVQSALRSLTDPVNPVDDPDGHHNNPLAPFPVDPSGFKLRW